MKKITQDNIDDVRTIKQYLEEGYGSTILIFNNPQVNDE